MKISKILGFKPKLIPTLFTIPALALLFYLSFWQFERLKWKESIIEELQTKIQLPEIELPKQVDLSTMLYRQVKLKGKYMHNQEMHMYGGSRSFKGKNGYYILTPMHLEDGRIIIINRGWVPENLKNSNQRKATLVEGIIEVEGYVMKQEEKTLYIHENQPDKNLWFYINLDEIRNFLHKPIENFYILAKDDPNKLPRGRNLDANIRNHHLNYALTWLFAAITLIILYFLYHRTINTEN